MWMIFLQFVLMFLIYLISMPAIYYFTDVRRPPRWLDFKPFSCRKCLTFWTLLGISLVIGLSFDWIYFMFEGIILAVATTYALYLDQKNKTIKISDFE